MTSIDQTPSYEPSGLKLEDFLDNPMSLRSMLEGHGALEFEPYPSGLFPASSLPPETAKSTGMGMAWLRDNAYIADALYRAGNQEQREQAVAVGEAMLNILGNNRDILDGVVSGRVDPGDLNGRLPVRVDGVTLDNDTEKRVQNDSVGLTLWLLGGLISDGALRPSADHVDNIVQTVRYTDAISYWRDKDHGHWEEDLALHTSSVGSVVAGLRSIQGALPVVFEKAGIDLQGLQRKGLDYTLSALPYERYDSGDRKYDAAHLLLIEPLQVIQGEIIPGITRHLIRQHGFARYEGDTYWAPQFTDILAQGARTTSAPGRLETRNRLAEGISRSKTEAQWTLFDSPISVHWGKRYSAHRAPIHWQFKLAHLDRSLSQFVRSPDGRLLLPEAHYLEYDGKEQRSMWMPNEHTPLLMAQAAFLLSLKQFEDLAP